MRLSIPWLVVACVLSVVAAPALAEGWKAGAASEKITPTEPMSMAGYGSRIHPSTGFINDLRARALVLEDAKGNRACVISLDLVGIDPTMAEPICDELKAKYGLQRSGIAICCSHTHSGPVLGKNLRTLHYDQLDAAQQKLADKYAAEFKEKVIALVGRAVDALAPSTLTFGQGEATFAVNRRNNKEPDVPRLREEGKLVGPVDHDVPVLRIAGDGKLKAVLFGYACHATVLSGYEWSSDYPGFAASAIEAAHPGCTALFFAGCGADQNPIPRRDVTLAKKYGDELAASVEKVLAAPLETVAPELRTAYAKIPLELAHVPSREEIAADAKSSDKYVAARARLYLSELDAGREIPKTYDYPIQAWRLGKEVTLVTLGGEVVVDYAVRIKGQYGRGRTWVAGYANDVMAYIPSRRVLSEGGYEGGGAMVYYSLPSPWMPTIEEGIVETVARLMAATK